MYTSHATGGLTPQTVELQPRAVVLGPAPVTYIDGLERQRQLHAAVVDGSAPDTVLLLEHDPVFTAGRRTEPHEMPFDGTPVVAVDRGGKITWHGPGQLVGYPIMTLSQPYDVVAHVRRIEALIMALCADLGLPQASRVDGRSGVWLAPDDPADPAGIFGGRPWRKVAAIGVRVARGVTMHGFAINADPDLSAFNKIVPCGIADAGVTSLSAELDRDVTVAQVLPVVLAHLGLLVEPAPRAVAAVPSRPVSSTNEKVAR